MKKLPPKLKLDPEERDLYESIERGEWILVEDQKHEKVVAKRAATRTLRQNVQVRAKLSTNDVSNIKQMAAFEGLPFEAYISSILHKLAAGHLAT